MWKDLLRSDHYSRNLDAASEQGLVGIGQYALELCECPAAARYSDALVSCCAVLEEQCPRKWYHITDHKVIGPEEQGRVS